MTDDPKELPAMGDAPTDAPKIEKKVPSKLKMPEDWDEALDGEWDDEYASEAALKEGADIRLIVEYLNKQLEPDQMEAVCRRLEEDPAFAELAEPLIVVWKIPRHIVRHPRPAGETERAWDELTKRLGFTHQKRKARRRRLWLLGIAFLVVGALAFVARAPLLNWYRIQRDFVAVPHDTAWIPLGPSEDSIFVRQEADVSVRVSREAIGGARHAILEGTAHFRVRALDAKTPEPRAADVVVRTRAGLVTSAEGDFTVTARGDTTDVEVHRPSVRRFMYIVPIPTGVVIRRDPTADLLFLRERDRGRLVRNRPPERLTDEP